MAAVNKAILVGNLGRDAELRYTAGGAAVSTFSIATTERFNDRDGNRKEDTQWHRIVMWGKLAETLTEYLTKGKQVYVEGKIMTREWEGKDGALKKQTEIRAERVVLLGGGRRERTEDDGGDGGGTHDEQVAADDDIPF